MTEWFLIQERYKNSLFPVYFIIEVMTREMQSIAGSALHKCVIINRGAHIQYWFDAGSWQELQLACLDKVRKNPKLISGLIRRFESKAPAFLGFIRRVHQSDLTRKSNPALWIAYDRYCRDYKRLGVLGEPLAISVKDVLASELETYLFARLKEQKLEKRFAEYFSTLVSPAVPSFASREELELVRLAVKARQKGLKAVRAALEKHAEAFFWLPYDYEGTTWDTAYFESVLEELIKKPAADLARQLSRQRNHFRELKKKQAFFAAQAGIDAVHTRLFRALRDASQAMDLKKEVLTQSHWYKNSLLKEIAVRLKIPFYHTYFLTPAEIKEGLLEGKLDRQRAKTRSRYCVSVCQNGHTVIETGENAIVWEHKMVSPKNAVAPEDTGELRGTCACPGSAIGKARVLLSSADIDQMQEREILVTQATTPDFVPAMKKACAIVTNEGGITSHAAIVSRELGIPCIVGTQNATNLIQTGDLLDVHAASGTVKKIKR